MSTDRSSDRSADPLRSLAIAAGLGFGASILAFGLVIALVNVLFLLGIDLQGRFGLALGIEFFINQVLVMGGISVAYLAYTGRGLDYINVRLPDLKGVALIVVGPIAVFMIVAAFSLVFVELGIEPSQHGLADLQDEVDPTFFLYLIPVSILIIGPFEELLYRGVIQTRLREALGPVSAITTASVIFALIHIPAYGMGLAAGGVDAVAASIGILFVGSLAFGAIYEYTQNLPVVAVVHGLYNGIQFLLVYISIVYEEELMEAAGDAIALFVVI